MKATSWIPALLMAGALIACNKEDDDDDAGLNDTDRTFMTQMSYGNHAEIDAGNAASTMASLGAVRSFGSMMVSDHTAAQAKLVNVGNAVGVTSLPDMPDSAHVRMKAMLLTMSGRAFDSTYMRMQVADHQNTINLLQQEISNGLDGRVKAYATEHLPAVQMHKHMADSIVSVNGF